MKVVFSNPDKIYLSVLIQFNKINLLRQSEILDNISIKYKIYLMSDPFRLDF